MSTDFSTIRNHYSLVDVAARYLPSMQKATGGEYKAICPFHSDTKPSLTFYQGGDGNWRYYCFACGAGAEGGDVIDFVANIENVAPPKAAELITGEKHPPPGQFKPQPPAETIEALWEPKVPVPEDATPYNPRRTFNPKQDKWKRYSPELKTPYYNAEGQLLFYVIRIPLPDGGKATMVVSYCIGPESEYRWCTKRMPPPYPLLGLNALAANPSKIVLLVEGEKCYDRAVKEPALKGFVPVSWLGGVNNIHKVDFSPLKGRWIMFSPDNDAEGEFAMLSIYNEIEKAGTG